LRSSRIPLPLGAQESRLLGGELVFSKNALIPQCLPNFGWDLNHASIFSAVPCGMLAEPSSVPLPMTLIVRSSILSPLVTENPVTSAMFTRKACVNEAGRI
jgi:hypothetical protein